MINNVNDNEGNYTVGLTEATLFEFVRPEQETTPGMKSNVRALCWRFGLVRKSRYRAKIHNRQDGSTTEGLSGNNEYQGARKAQLPDDESPSHVPQSPRWFHRRIVW